MLYEMDGNVATCWQVVDQEVAYRDVSEQLHWCLEYEGLGRFYSDPMFGMFYFERDEDREMFLLRWGGL